MAVSRILEGIAKSKPGQKLYGWCAKQGHDKILNNTLPQVETVLSTACYVVATERQKNIDRDRKNLLQIQNVASGAVGVVLGSMANRWIGKMGEGVIEHLDPKALDPKTIRKISSGIRIGLPILITGTLMRYIVPSILAWFSGVTMDKVREKRDGNPQKLNIKA